MWGQINEQNALNMGMDPQWAKLTGDFSSTLFLEGFTTVTINGVRAYKNITTGEIIYDGSFVAGSGVGNLAKGSKSIDPSSLSDVWKLGATERGDVIEEVLASTEYKDWYNIGSSQGGYFPVIDFQKGIEVVSLKTIDPKLPSYTGDMSTEKILEYLQDLNRNITVNRQLADKILDVRIPEGTINKIDVQEIITQAKDMGIKVQIKEFK